MSTPGHPEPEGPAVVLIGPPGSGKSSVAAAVGGYTGLPVRDTDTDVEAMSGRTITDIFTQDGEAVFRELEVSAVTAALAEHRGVLALGGGAVMNPRVRELLAGRRVVFLCVSMPVGVRRTGLAATRPLLVGVNPRATYKALLDARLPIYREVATLEVDTDDLSVDQVAQVITAEFGL
jgi:shikimate kinase